MANTDTATVATTKRNGNGNGNGRNVPTMAQALKRAEILGTAQGNGRVSEIEMFQDIAWLAFHGTLPHADTKADAADDIDHVRNLVKAFLDASNEAASKLDPLRKLRNADGTKKKDTLDNKVSKFRHAAMLGAVEGINLEIFFDHVIKAIPTIVIPAGRPARPAFECWVIAAKAQHDEFSEKPMTLAQVKETLVMSTPSPRSVETQWKNILKAVSALYDDGDKRPEVKEIKEKVALRVAAWTEKNAKKKAAAKK